MASPPALSGREVVKIFARDGWRMVRQRGGHMIPVKDGHMGHKEVAKGTLRSLIRSRGLTFEEFTALAEK